MIIQHDDMSCSPGFMPILLQTWPGRWVNSFGAAFGRWWLGVWRSDFVVTWVWRMQALMFFLNKYSILGVPASNLTVQPVSNFSMPAASTCDWHASWYKLEEKPRTVRRPRTSSTVEISPRTRSGSHLFCMFPFAHFEHFNYMPWNVWKNSHCNGVTAWSWCPSMCKSFKDCNAQHRTAWVASKEFPTLFPRSIKSIQIHWFSNHQERAIGCVDIMRHFLIHQYQDANPLKTTL